MTDTQDTAAAVQVIERAGAVDKTSAEGAGRDGPVDKDKAKNNNFAEETKTPDSLATPEDGDDGVVAEDNKDVKGESVPLAQASLRDAAHEGKLEAEVSEPAPGHDGENALGKHEAETNESDSVELPVQAEPQVGNDEQKTSAKSERKSTVESEIETLSTMWQLPAAWRLLTLFFSAGLNIPEVSPSQLEVFLANVDRHYIELEEIHARLLGLGPASYSRWLGKVKNFARLNPAEYSFVYEHPDADHLYYGDEPNDDGLKLKDVASYKELDAQTRLKILHCLLERQISDLEGKLGDEIRALAPEELRLHPCGYDAGHNMYWYFGDLVRIYREPDLNYRRQKEELKRKEAQRRVNAAEAAKKRKRRGPARTSRETGNDAVTRVNDGEEAGNGGPVDEEGSEPHEPSGDDDASHGLQMNTRLRDRIENVLKPCECWEVIAQGVDQLEELIEGLGRQRNPMERSLRKYLQTHVLPQWEEHERRTRKERVKQEKGEEPMYNTKRSARIQALELRREEEMKEERDREVKEQQVEVARQQQHAVLIRAERERNRELRMMRSTRNMGYRPSALPASNRPLREARRTRASEQLDGANDMDLLPTSLGGVLLTEDDLADEEEYNHFVEDGVPNRVLDRFRCLGPRGETSKLEYLDTEPDAVISVEGVLVPAEWSDALPQMIRVPRVEEWCIDYSETALCIRSKSGAWYRLSRPSHEYRWGFAGTRRRFEICARLYILANSMSAASMTWDSVIELLGQQYYNMKSNKESEIVEIAPFIVSQIDALGHPVLNSCPFTKRLRRMMAWTSKDDGNVEVAKDGAVEAREAPVRGSQDEGELDTGQRSDAENARASALDGASSPPSMTVVGQVPDTSTAAPVAQASPDGKARRASSEQTPDSAVRDQSVPKKAPRKRPAKAVEALEGDHGPANAEGSSIKAPAPRPRVKHPKEAKDAAQSQEPSEKRKKLKTIKTADSSAKVAPDPQSSGASAAPTLTLAGKHDPTERLTSVKPLVSPVPSSLGGLPPTVPSALEKAHATGASNGLPSPEKNATKTTTPPTDKPATIKVSKRAKLDVNEKRPASKTSSLNASNAGKSPFERLTNARPNEPRAEFAPATVDPPLSNGMASFGADKPGAQGSELSRVTPSSAFSVGVAGGGRLEVPVTTAPGSLAVDAGGSEHALAVQPSVERTAPHAPSSGSSAAPQDAALGRATADRPAQAEFPPSAAESDPKSIAPVHLPSTTLPKSAPEPASQRTPLTQELPEPLTTADSSMLEGLRSSQAAPTGALAERDSTPATALDPPATVLAAIEPRAAEAHRADLGMRPASPQHPTTHIADTKLAADKVSAHGSTPVSTLLSSATASASGTSVQTAQPEVQPPPKNGSFPAMAGQTLAEVLDDAASGRNAGSESRDALRN